MRFALGIEYDGSGFNGWQAQPDDPSVQVCLQKALSLVADHNITLSCAGRTDTGVHALCQVAHFDSNSVRSERQWILGINSNLPATVSVRWVKEVSADFHARFSAYQRSYRYIILNRWVRPALCADQVSWCRKPLDETLMNEAVACLEGEHDFSAFQSAGCSALHAVRKISSVSVSRSSDEVFIDISANGFLYHMVRNIAGSLMEVGKGLKSVGWLAQLMEGRDRKKAGMTAPAQGLYFIAARYPDSFGIPTTMPAFPKWD